MKDIPVYRFPAEHARENGELELYRASNKANTACKEAIEKSISEHYCDNVLHGEAVAQVAEQFGHERRPSVLGRLKSRPPEAAAETVKKTKEPSL